jgi:hypothetical protein
MAEDKSRTQIQQRGDDTARLMLEEIARGYVEKSGMDARDYARQCLELLAMPLPPEATGSRIDNGNTFVFCDSTRQFGTVIRACVRGAGHNGPHAYAMPPYPQEPVLLVE